MTTFAKLTDSISQTFMLALGLCAIATISGCGAGMTGKSDTSAAPNVATGLPDVVLPPTPPPSATPAAQNAFDLKAQVTYYDQLYRLHDPYTKLVDDSGNGYNALYGTRNFRAVLTGVYYRGGAENTQNVNGKRSNSNPLQNGGVENLCEQGFSEAIYLYDTNYASAEPSAKCKTLRGTEGAIAYDQITGLTSANQVKLLTKVYEHIKGIQKGPLYGHCWNGWHASGFVAAISLRQFCGWTGAEADNYWVKNTDGNSAGYDSIRTRIKAFVPYAQLKISSEEQALICPASK